MLSPQNLTSETGKSVSFQCGVNGMTNNERIRFSIIGPKVNTTLTCPGQKTTYLPSQVKHFDLNNCADSITSPTFRHFEFNYVCHH